MRLVLAVCVLLLLSGQAAADQQEDPYKILGVTKRSSQVHPLTTHYEHPHAFLVDVFECVAVFPVAAQHARLLTYHRCSYHWCVVQAEIKKAWKEMAKLYHPDKNPGDKLESAQAAFIRASDAYSILSDPEKKEEWDRYGSR
jgi:hypothetical protein